MNKHISKILVHQILISYYYLINKSELIFYNKN